VLTEHDSRPVSRDAPRVRGRIQETSMKTQA
jgi:hypothetical protein